jgi:hypothetical protein
MEPSAAASDIERLARTLFGREIVFGPFSESLCLLRVVVLTYDLQVFFKTEEAGLLLPLLDRVRELLEHFDDFSAAHPDFFSYLQESASHLDFLRGESPLERSAWRDQRLGSQVLGIPGMITPDAMRYYKWLGKRASGAGDAVEIGCWMGRSTASLAGGLIANPSFGQRRLHVFDKFTWDDSLARHSATHRQEFTPEAAAALCALRPGDSNLELFLELCSAFRSVIEPHVCYLYREGEAGTLPPLAWQGQPVELFVQDLTNDYHLVRQIWDEFSPSFIPGKTIVVFHQYGHPRAEGLRRFCREHADHLRAVHKPFGAAKGFLFMGRR